MTINTFIDRLLLAPSLASAVPNSGKPPVVGYLAQHHLFEQVRSDRFCLSARTLSELLVVVYSVTYNRSQRLDGTSLRPTTARCDDDQTMMVVTKTRTTTTWR